jgi:hypothetical protein
MKTIQRVIKSEKLMKTTNDAFIIIALHMIHQNVMINVLKISKTMITTIQKTSNQDYSCHSSSECDVFIADFSINYWCYCSYLHWQHHWSSFNWFRHWRKLHQSALNRWKCTLAVMKTFLNDENSWQTHHMLLWHTKTRH